jgi:starch synthase
MKTLIVASEAVPFAKTGGLADVCGTLPAELARLGQSVAVIMPAYRSALRSGQPIEPTGIAFEIPMGTKTVAGSLLQSTLPDSDVRVYLVQQDAYFDRDQLYGENGADFKDNCERFVFFCRAVMEAIRLVPLELDLIHVHDWQAALVPALLKTEYAGVPGYENVASLFTIHNLAYQGRFWHWDMLLTGMDWKYFNWRQMEFFGDLNLMKTGLVFADALNTVSPRYAQEIQTPEHGCGLEGVLRERRAVLSGIVNGVDYNEWNPVTDRHIAANFTAEHVQPGKGICKAALQKTLGLPRNPKAPLVGLVGRLAAQKGLDLVEGVIMDWVRTSDTQWAILGTGEPKYQELFERLADEFPDKVAVKIGFSNALAHMIEAGADVFLMPSRYEPCGLNQLFSLKYGTVPVVRATGGLADTIVDATDVTIADGTATGFSFDAYEVRALAEALTRADSTYRERPEVWRQLIATGMRQDWSWANSARKYIDLYRQTVARVREPAAALA